MRNGNNNKFVNISRWIQVPGWHYLMIPQYMRIFTYHIYDNKVIKSPVNYLSISIQLWVRRPYMNTYSYTVILSFHWRDFSIRLRLICLSGLIIFQSDFSKTESPSDYNSGSLAYVARETPLSIKSAQTAPQQCRWTRFILECTSYYLIIM